MITNDKIEYFLVIDKVTTPSYQIMIDIIDY